MVTYRIKEPILIHTAAKSVELTINELTFEHPSGIPTFRPNLDNSTNAIYMEVCIKLSSSYLSIYGVTIFILTFNLVDINWNKFTILSLKNQFTFFNKLRKFQSAKVYEATWQLFKAFTCQFMFSRIVFISYENWESVQFLGEPDILVKD